MKPVPEFKSGFESERRMYVKFKSMFREKKL